MYKWVRLKEVNGKLCYHGIHLNDGCSRGYMLKATANEERVIIDAEIVQ